MGTTPITGFVVSRVDHMMYSWQERRLYIWLRDRRLTVWLQCEADYAAMITSRVLVKTMPYEFLYDVDTGQLQRPPLPRPLW